MKNVAEENEKAISGTIKIDEKEIRTHFSYLSRIRHALLNAEANATCQASRYQRTQDRHDPRAGTDKRKLQRKAEEVSARLFDTQIIERHKTKQSKIKDVLIEMVSCECIRFDW